MYTLLITPLVSSNFSWEQNEKKYILSDVKTFGVAFTLLRYFPTKPITSLIHPICHLQRKHRTVNIVLQLQVSAKHCKSFKVAFHNRSFNRWTLNKQESCIIRTSICEWNAVNAHILCCFFAWVFFILCTLCCQFLCIVQVLLPIRFSLTLF
jgi:hypothetical protein